MSNENEKEMEVDALKSEVEGVKLILGGMFDTDGECFSKDFMTSMEIRYELSEMVEVELGVLNRALSELGFGIDFILGVAHWVVYPKNW